MKAPSTPNIKRYLKACKNGGYKPTALKVCYSGDVMLFFDDEIRSQEIAKDEWEEEIEKT